MDQNRVFEALDRHRVTRLNEWENLTIYKDREGGRYVYWMDNRDTGGRTYIKPDSISRLTRQGYRVVDISKA